MPLGRIFLQNQVRPQDQCHIAAKAALKPYVAPSVIRPWRLTKLRICRSGLSFIISSHVRIC